MIYDIKKELRSFTYITSVYKCISAYNLKGHQIGRKIGDMLEILTMAGIYKCPDLISHLDTEGKLEGFSTAGHKVEFGFYQNLSQKTGLFGAIECKCVGVEETTAGKGKNHLRNLSDNECFTIELNAHWMEHPISQTVTLISHTTDTVNIKLTNSQNTCSDKIKMSIGENIKLIITEKQELIHITPSGNMLEEIPEIIRICKTIKLDNITNGLCQFSLYNCLTGPQTIEKAKQVSFVAMDLRKKIDGHWGKEEISEKKRHMNFLHVICEYSHWEEKSRNVIKTCIDHNIIVPDAVLIKSFEFFEAQFGAQNMLNKISKKNYLASREIRDVIEQVFLFFDNHIFYDLSLESYIKFDYQNKSLLVREI